LGESTKSTGITSILAPSAFLCTFFLNLEFSFL
jgi:hypothetical protein